MDLRDVTVVVPSKNEIKNLPSFLASLPKEVPLVLVDASSDGTPGLLLNLRPENTSLILSRANIAEARNSGARMAKTSYLLFTDADITFAPNYFDQLHLLDPRGALYGPKLSNGAYQTYYRSFTVWQVLFDRLGIPAVSGSNFLIPRNLFLAIGGFDQQLQVNEDTELGFRLIRKGYRVQFDRQLQVFAGDHRRLKRGVVRKIVHSLSRCALIYFNLFPSLWRGKDWGYW